LRHRIARGDFTGQRQLPTEAELATQFAVSRQTVRRAYQDLVAEGLVVRERGRGSFAAAPTDGYIRQVGSIDDLMGLSEDTALEVISPLRRTVDPISASRLRLDSDVVHEVRFARSHGAVRFCVTTVVLPPEVAQLLGDVTELTIAGSRTSLTIIGLLDDRLTTRINEAQQSITVGQVPLDDADSLGCEPGRATLRIDRLYLDSDGNGVELAISHFLPEHYSYRISLRRGVDPRR
jgi:DNA-binding GntR family transcriptional regulator